MDYKTNSSGMMKYMINKNLSLLRSYDVFKIVCNKDDFSDIKDILRNNDIKSYIYLSPIFNEIQPSELVDFLKELHNEGFDTSKIRIQIQLHKIIWDPNKRGV